MDNKKSIWQPGSKWWMFGLPTGAFIAALFGVLAWGGFNFSFFIETAEPQELSVGKSVRDLGRTSYMGRVFIFVISGLLQ